MICSWLLCIANGVIQRDKVSVGPVVLNMTLRARFRPILRYFDAQKEKDNEKIRGFNAQDIFFIIGHSYGVAARMSSWCAGQYHKYFAVCFVVNIFFNRHLKISFFPLWSATSYHKARSHVLMSWMNDYERQDWLSTELFVRLAVYLVCYVKSDRGSSRSKYLECFAANSICNHITALAFTTR